MRRDRKYWIIILLIFGFPACQNQSGNQNYREKIQNPAFYHQTVKKLTDVIVHDIFSPPVASRIYAYPAIAAYEAMVPSQPDKFVSLSGQLKGLKPVPQPQQGSEICYELASLRAFITLAKTKVYSEEKIQAYEDNLYKEVKGFGLPQGIFQRSLDYGDQVAQHILAWSEEDNYKQTRSFPKYTIQEGNAFWQPTPPDYMEGIEPHWNKIRPMVLDSANQFLPEPPTEFDLDTTSKFFDELMEVYEIGKGLDGEQEAIAKFWDCNPYVSHHRGHAMFAVKKITPGGHWVGITGIAARQASLDFMQTTEAYAQVSIALMDAFISCWDEKWRSILVRPETVINQHIDEEWTPLLQTPPFPEYTSGHSVISRAAAVALTDLLGDNFAFKDTVEVEYGLPARDYPSFLKASEEAAISRLYGGIHYRKACEEGVSQGQKVGDLIVKRLNTRAGDLARKEE